MKETTNFSARTPRASALASKKKYSEGLDSSDDEDDFKPTKKATQPRSASQVTKEPKVSIKKPAAKKKPLAPVATGNMYE